MTDVITFTLDGREVARARPDQRKCARIGLWR
jgi:hypothetical protein